MVPSNGNKVDNYFTITINNDLGIFEVKSGTTIHRYNVVFDMKL